jgi:peroxiredoxin
VFVIGPDGKIVARFDNVAAKAEVEAALERLPTT